MENISDMAAFMHYELDIKRIRKACGKSVAEIAADMWVSPSTVYRWESLDTDPSSADISKLAKLLSCTPGDLFVIKFANGANNV